MKAFTHTQTVVEMKVSRNSYVGALWGKRKVFDRVECRNCVFKVAATVGINVHTASGGGVRVKCLKL